MEEMFLPFITLQTTWTFLFSHKNIQGEYYDFFFNRFVFLPEGTLDKDKRFKAKRQSRESGIRKRMKKRAFKINMMKSVKKNNN